MNSHASLLRKHWHIIFAATAGWALDAFDFTILLFLIPHLGKVFNVGLPQMALVVTATGFANIAGTIGWGFAADSPGNLREPRGCHYQRHLRQADVKHFAEMRDQEQQDGEIECIECPSRGRREDDMPMLPERAGVTVHRLSPSTVARNTACRSNFGMVASLLFLLRDFKSA